MTNIVVITIDCLRADHLHCYGYPRSTTPNIDKLARSGARFSNAVSTGPYTSLSFPSIMTSTYASVHVRRSSFGGISGAFRLSRWCTTFAEICKQSGFATAGFHSNPNLSRLYGYDRGFDIYLDLVRPKGGLRSMLSQRILTQGPVSRIFDSGMKSKAFGIFRNPYLDVLMERPYSDAGQANDSALTWLGFIRQPRPFFMWVHYMDVHGPYVMTGSYLRRVRSLQLDRKKQRTPEHITEQDLQELRIMYDRQIRVVDSAVGSLIRRCEEIGVSKDNTIFVITSDHGEEFKDHGGLGHTLRHGGHRLYDEMICVPLLIIGPEVAQGLVVHNQISLIGLCPTLADLAGIDCGRAMWMGSSFLPLMDQKKHANLGTGSISESLSRRITAFSYRTREYKYILSYCNERECRELYFLDRDPRELDNRAQEAKEIAKRSEEEIVRHLELIRRVKTIPGFGRSIN